MNNCPVMINEVTHAELYAEVRTWAIDNSLPLEFVDRGKYGESFVIDNATEEVCNAVKGFISTLVDKYPDALNFDEEEDVSFGKDEDYLVIYPSSRHNRLSVYSW